MSPESDWLADPFLDQPTIMSLDGGTTNRGVLWHGVSPRWGHALHSACSYHGMFPARLAHYFIKAYTNEGETVLDPFSGRGTTALEARLTGRRAIANDLSPLAYVLTKSKIDTPTWSNLNLYVDDLERRFQTSRISDESVSADIRMLFHPTTLKQLVFIRANLLGTSMLTWSPEETMVAASIAGILHGNQRSDGSSAYLSISMPNTFSMSPSYVARFIAENGLEPPEQDVFDRLRDKIARLYSDRILGETGVVFNDDAVSLLRSDQIAPASVDLLLTSPPYLNVVNYGTANWIRLWWLGLDDVSRQAGRGRQVLDALLDHSHTYERYMQFVRRLFLGIERVLKPSGMAAVVIGDVTRGDRTQNLAERIWADVGPSSGLQLYDMIEDALATQTKVSRIWADTKGKATSHDRVLLLGKKRGSGRTPNSVLDWSEPYRDAGPDEAYSRAYRAQRGRAALNK